MGKLLLVDVEGNSYSRVNYLPTRSSASYIVAKSFEDALKNLDSEITGALVIEDNERSVAKILELKERLKARGIEFMLKTRIPEEMFKEEDEELDFRYVSPRSVSAFSIIKEYLERHTFK